MSEEEKKRAIELMNKSRTEEEKKEFAALHNKYCLPHLNPQTTCGGCWSRAINRLKQLI